MPQQQNPTAKGDRVLWNSLVGASTESLTLSAYRAQHLIGSYGIRPEHAGSDTGRTAQGTAFRKWRIRYGHIMGQEGLGKALQDLPCAHPSDSVLQLNTVLSDIYTAIQRFGLVH